MTPCHGSPSSTDAMHDGSARNAAKGTSPRRSTGSTAPSSKASPSPSRNKWTNRPPSPACASSSATPGNSSSCGAETQAIDAAVIAITARWRMDNVSVDITSRTVQAQYAPEGVPPLVMMTVTGSEDSRDLDQLDQLHALTRHILREDMAPLRRRTRPQSDHLPQGHLALVDLRAGRRTARRNALRPRLRHPQGWSPRWSSLSATASAGPSARAGSSPSTSHRCRPPAQSAPPCCSPTPEC